MPDKVVREPTVYLDEETIELEKKSYTVTPGSNCHGRFVRIVEEINGRKNFLFIGAENAQELCDMIMRAKIKTDHIDD